MTNTELIKDKVEGTPETAPQEVTVETSAYKNILTEEEVVALEVRATEAEDKLAKVEFTREKLEREIVEAKNQVKTTKVETPTVEGETDIANIVKKQLEVINKEKEATDVQDLISGIEDPYKRAAIVKEMSYISETLPAKERFTIANRNADLQVKANTNVPDVDTQQGATSASSSYTRKDANPNEELIKKAYERAGLIYNPSKQN